MAVSQDVSFEPMETSPTFAVEVAGTIPVKTKFPNHNTDAPILRLGIRPWIKKCTKENTKITFVHVHATNLYLADLLYIYRGLQRPRQTWRDVSELRQDLCDLRLGGTYQ